MKALTFLSVLVLLSTPAAFAGLRCENVFKTIPLQDSAVEIEIGATILEPLFTTTDGTIGPVIHPLNEKGVPAHLLSQLKDSYPDQNINSIPWDVLSPKEKEQLILYATQARKQFFFDDRNVQGLAYREVIQLSFTEPTQFMGRAYTAGRHTVASKDLFTNTKIEFSGPKGMSEYLGFEIHLRRADGAGNNLASSSALQKALVGKPASVHQHVVAPMPAEKMAQAPALEAFKIVEFYRRVSLHAQFLRVVRGHEIRELTANAGDISYVNMPVLTKNDLEKFFGYYLRTGQWLKSQKKTGWIQLIKDKSKEAASKIGLIPGDAQGVGKLAEKSGLIGMRAGSVYDGNGMLWGLEFRDLAPSHDQKHLRSYLDSIQSRMLLEDLGVKDQTAEAALHYGDQMFDKILYPNLNSVTSKLEKMGKRGLAHDIKLKENVAVGLLFHDWSADPIVLENPQYLGKIQEAQKMGLESLYRGQDHKEVLARFVKRSGLQYIVWKSLAVE